MRKKIFFKRHLEIIYGSIIFLISISLITVDWLPRYPDPFGYLANAKYFSGDTFTWSDISGNMASYYSYGYSIVISLFFRIFDSYILISKAICIINAFFLVGTYVFLTKILRKISNNISGSVCFSICFLICIYPSYIFRVYYAVTPELLCLFLATISVFLFMKLEDNNCLIYSALLGLVLSFMPAVHGRCLGIWAIGCCIIGIMFIFHRITVKQMAIFSIISIGGIIVYLFINRIIKMEVYQLAKIGEYSNSGTGTIKNISNFITPIGFKNICTTFFSQLFYLSSTTFLVYLIGLFSIFLLIKKFRTKHIIQLYDCTKLYIGLAALAILFLSAASFQNPKRIDHILYGRHNEMFMPFIIILGCDILSKKIKNSKRTYKILFASCQLFLICSFVTYLKLIHFNSSTSIPRTIIGLSLFYDIITVNPGFIFAIAFLVIYIVRSYWYLKRNFSSKYTGSIIVLTISMIYFITSYEAIKTEYEDTKINKNPFLEIQELADYKGKEIYAIKNDSASMAYLLQIIFMNEKVHLLDRDKMASTFLDSREQPALIYSDDEEIPSSLDKCYSVCNILENINGKLWVYGEDYAEYLKQKGYILVDSLLNLISSDKFIYNRIPYEKEGYAILGPYIGLDPGSYEVIFQMDSESSESGELGFIEVVNNSNNTIICSKSWNGSSQYITVPFSLNKKTDNIEFRYYKCSNNDKFPVSVMLYNVENAENMSILQGEININAFRYSDISELESGYNMYGPYISLDPGAYEVIFQFNNTASEPDIKGVLEVVSDYGDNIISSIDWDGTACFITLNFQLNEKTDNIEFRYFKNSGNNTIPVRVILINQPSESD